MRILTVLIIEDAEKDAQLLVTALSHAGCTPLPVLSRAEDGVGYLEGTGEYTARDRHPLPSLIVLDLTLPGMSGLEFLAWLQQQPGLSRIPAIVLSGSLYSQDVKKAYALGAKTFFAKPLESPQLDQLAQAIVWYWSASISAKGEQSTANGPELRNIRTPPTSQAQGSA
jgi:CheY-like chemotaxis protein